MLMRHGFWATGGQFTHKRQQPDRPPFIDMLHGRKLCQYSHRTAQLLCQLAVQCVHGQLPRLHLATREFPQATQPLPRRAAGQ